MADEQEQDRSEQPSPFKLTRAREKGTVARGTDLGFLVGLAAFTGYAFIAGPGLGERIAEASRKALVSAPALAASPQGLLWAQIRSTMLCPSATSAAA